MKRFSRAALFASVGFVPLQLCSTDSAFAQSVGQADSVAEAGSDSDIIVTARRRDERLVDVPVAITAISGETLSNKQLTNIEALTTQVPQLRVSANSIGLGGIITMRGVSSANSTASIEQAVAVNIDGIPLSYAGVLRLGQFDLGQAEILRGPQALFFGKNSTGGIISLRSAAPTDELTAKLVAGYEFEARERFVEAYVSGPLGDGINGRLAGRYSKMRGYIFNAAVAGGSFPFQGFGVPDPYGRGTEDYILKGSLDFDKGGPFTLKLRAMHGQNRTDGLVYTERFFCPSGLPSGPAVKGETDCSLNHISANGNVDPALNAVDPRFPADGVAYSNFRQSLLVADAAYQLSDGLSLSSLTGYYDFNVGVSDHSSYGSASFIEFASTTKKRSISQEVRLTSSFSGPFNFMTGIFYQDDKFSEDQRVRIVAPVPFIGPLTVFGQTWSPFIQGSYKFLDQLTVSAGVRYTHETKRETVTGFQNQLPGKLTFNDWSPEVTLSWKPTADVNIYAGYKEAYKAGGFQTEWATLPGRLAAGVTINNSFQPETARGFEGGVKASVLDRQLNLGLSAYTYRYNGLQLGRFDPVTVTTIIQNVGASRVSGAEAEFQYRPRGTGLTINGSVAYNDAHFISYVSGCFNGQTAAQGCFANAANGQAQVDLAGKALPRAPRWVGNFGANWEGDVASGLKLRLNGAMQFTGSFDPSGQHIPAARQGAYTLFDASVALAEADDRWEIAFIGRNLANKLFVNNAFQIPATGAGNSGAGGVLTVGRAADLGAVTPRGRELLLRLTYKLF